MNSVKADTILAAGNALSAAASCWHDIMSVAVLDLWASLARFTKALIELLALLCLMPLPVKAAKHQMYHLSRRSSICREYLICMAELTEQHHVMFCCTTSAKVDEGID